MATDYVIAYREVCSVKEQTNEVLDELKNNNGEICFEYIEPHHRMALPFFFEDWMHRGLKMELEIDTVIVHPLLWCKVNPKDEWCNEKHYLGYDYVYGADDRLIIKIPDSISASRALTISMDYQMPKRKYRDVMEKVHLYNYNKHVTLTKTYPDCSNEGYEYYFFPPISSKDKIIMNMDISVSD